MYIYVIIRRDNRLLHVRETARECNFRDIDCRCTCARSSAEIATKPAEGFSGGWPGVCVRVCVCRYREPGRYVVCLYPKECLREFSRVPLLAVEPLARGSWCENSFESWFREGTRCVNLSNYSVEREIGSSNFKRYGVKCCRWIFLHQRAIVQCERFNNIEWGIWIFAKPVANKHYTEKSRIE